MTTNQDLRITGKITRAEAQPQSRREAVTLSRYLFLLHLHTQKLEGDFKTTHTLIERVVCPLCASWHGNADYTRARSHHISNSIRLMSIAA